ncbi:MAG: hypothetical protein J1F38_05165 [Muribaculaceae bacterium]|nr:hypothetical protein [Muribaculaceae bacterium]
MKKFKPFFRKNLLPLIEPLESEENQVKFYKKYISPFFKLFFVLSFIQPCNCLIEISLLELKPITFFLLFVKIAIIWWFSNLAKKIAKKLFIFPLASDGIRQYIKYLKT